MANCGVTYSSNGESNETVFDRILYRLLSPLARLCLKHGVTFATAAEKLKLSFVNEALQLHPGVARHGMVSRIATATGINRREITRLLAAVTPRRFVRQPPAAEIMAHWVTKEDYSDAEGVPLTIPRQGEGVSFESLARKVTQDVHPRTLLEELLRLNLASYDADTDQVQLLRKEYIPSGDDCQMFSFLADNVGDHLEGAVDNLLEPDADHLEQAVFADELSDQSVRQLRPMLVKQWQRVRKELVPVISAMIDADRKAGRKQDQRIRLGLYSYSEGVRPPSERGGSDEKTG